MIEGQECTTHNNQATIDFLGKLRRTHFSIFKILQLERSFFKIMTMYNYSCLNNLIMNKILANNKSI